MTSYSGYQTMMRCLRAYKYRYVDNLQKKRDYNAAPYKGTAFHAMMEEHNHERSAWKRCVLEIDNVTTDGDLYEEEKEERVAIWEEAFDMYERYLRSSICPDVKEILSVEEEFMVTLPDGNVVTGTPDLVYEDWNGDIWIVDYKTTSSIPMDLPFGNMQALIYLLLVGSVWGHDQVKGFRYHYIRSKVPTEPRLKKDGSAVAYLNTLDTTFETLRDFLTTHAPHLLNDDDHKRRLGELRQVDSWFKEFIIWNTAELRQTTYQELVARNEVRKYAEETGTWPRSFVSVGFGSCDGCSYNAICKADWFGHDTRLVLQGYEARAPRQNEEEK